MTELYPAIDLLDGKVVRLLQGDYDRDTVYGDDPVAVAEGFAADGATWVHVVDLDAAKSGSPRNRAVVAAIASALIGTARIQTGGGVRSLDDVAALRDAGVARVVMGSAAVQQPDLVAQAAELMPVAVGLDHRGGELAVHGWTAGSGVQLHAALSWFPNASAFVITDIGRDGMLTGPDVEGLAAAAALTTVPIIASGGVATLADVVACAALVGVTGVITGKALYEGRFTVPEAVAALAARR
jgi:phosphoribosylformimino-5-aminoimidazole carboxamide ribotide isomerase